MTNREPPRRKKARGLLLRHGYAVGGHVKQAIAEAVHAHERHDRKGRKLTRLRRGGAAEGEAAAMRADKPRRAAGGRNKKAGTKVVIVNAGHAPEPLPVPVPRPVPVPAAATPAPRPALPPGLVPSLPGAARPAMAKRGGRIGMTVGAKNALGRLQKMRAYGEH